MSGGSYNYLCYKDGPDLMNAQADLGDMAKRLAGLEHGKAAAHATEQLLAFIEYVNIQLSVRQKLLQNVWHAVEWRDSGDYADDQLDKALQRWNETAGLEE